MPRPPKNFVFVRPWTKLKPQQIPYEIFTFFCRIFPIVFWKKFPPCFGPVTKIFGPLVGENFFAGNALFV